MLDTGLLIVFLVDSGLFSIVGVQDWYNSNHARALTDHVEAARGLLIARGAIERRVLQDHPVELESLKKQIQAQAPRPRELNLLVILAAACGILSIIMLTMGVIQLDQPNGMVLVVLATFLLCGMIAMILFNGRR